MKVLVTGAAGLIGGELCARLAHGGHAVTALVHRRPEVLGNAGRVVPVAAVLRGDVTQPGLGLGARPPALDLVIHCAAALEFDAPEAQLSAINVAGTRHAAAFAKAAGARLLHVSTAYVCGLSEGPIAEAPVAPGTRFANNYEASKAAAEAVVRASGVPQAIARPSIVLGDSATGAIREFPAICNLFRLMARGTIRTLPVAPARHARLRAGGLRRRGLWRRTSPSGWTRAEGDDPPPGERRTAAGGRAPAGARPLRAFPAAHAGS